MAVPGSIGEGPFIGLSWLRLPAPNVVNVGMLSAPSAPLAMGDLDSVLVEGIIFDSSACRA